MSNITLYFSGVSLALAGGFLISSSVAYELTVVLAVVLVLLGGIQMGIGIGVDQ